MSLTALTAGLSGGVYYTPYDLGLSSALWSISGQNAQWLTHTLSSYFSSYAGGTGHVVWKYESGTSYTGDIQLDNVTIDGTNYSFETSDDGFTASTSNGTTTAYSSVNWGTIPTSASNGRWIRDSGGTPSGGTGLTTAAAGSYYLYVETSGSPPYTAWLRTPSITFDASPDVSFSMARSGATIGTMTVYVDMTA